MNPFKRLKKQIKAKAKLSQKERLIKKYGRSGLARQCMNCKHFVYREEKPRNYVCRCPNDKLRFHGTVCLGFEYGAHPEMVVMHSR